MKKKTIIYESPELRVIGMVVRSMIATSLWGETENEDTESGFYKDGYGNEAYGTDTGKW